MGIEIYAGGRHCGKTAWIIEKSSRTGIPIAVVSTKHGVEIMKLAKDMGYEIPNPIQFSLNFVDPCPGSVLVDDLDEFIPKLIKGLDIYAGTVTALNMKKGDKEKMDEFYKGPKVDCMGNPIEPVPGTSMHRDPVGPDGPSGDNWQERLSREYHDTKVRYELLHIHNVKEKAKRVKEVCDVSTPEQKNSQELLFRQENIMREYLDVLEIRMAMAGLAI